MVGAAVLHPFLRGIYRFSTSGHQEELDTYYVASRQLPRPELHQLKSDSSQGISAAMLNSYSLPRKTPMLPL